MVRKMLKKTFIMLLAIMVVFSGMTSTFASPVYASEEVPENTVVLEASESFDTAGTNEVSSEEINEVAPKLEEPIVEEAETSNEEDSSEISNNEMDVKDNNEEVSETISENEDIENIENTEELMEEEQHNNEEVPTDNEEVNEESPSKEEERKVENEEVIEEKNYKKEADKLDEKEEYSKNNGDSSAYKEVIKFFTPKSDSILGYPLENEAPITSSFGATNDGAHYGYNHSGIDFAASMGAPVLSAEKGTVIRASWFDAYGNCIDIDHGDGLVTRYGHLSEINVKVGDTVTRSQQIGLVGSTGRSTGPHLHFEVILNGASVDPMPYLEETKEKEGLTIIMNGSTGTAIIDGKEYSLAEGENLIKGLENDFVSVYVRSDYNISSYSINGVGPFSASGSNNTLNYGMAPSKAIFEINTAKRRALLKSSPTRASMTGSYAITNTLESGGGYLNGGSTSYEFSVSADGNSYFGFCIYPDDALDYAGYSTMTVANTNLRRAAYYAYLHYNEWGTAGKIGIHRQLAYYAGNDVSRVGWSVYGGSPEAVSNFVNSSAVVQEEFEAYYCYTGSGQDHIAYRMGEPQDGYIKIIKSSSNTSITDGNSCYSLEGARYGIYASQADANSDTNRIETLTTGANGVTNTSGKLKKGNYYVKEISAPKGYDINESVNLVVVEPKETTTFNTTDKPADDPSRLTIYKVMDHDKTRRITESSAVFKVEFFANEDWSGEAERVWYYKTVDGRTFLEDEDYLSEDYTNSEFYRASAGQVTYPLGTIKVTEVEAPYGYKALGADFELKGRIYQNEEGEGAFEWVSDVSSKIFYDADNNLNIANEQKYFGIKLQKVDLETGKNIPQTLASLTNAEITIYNKSGKAIDVKDGDSTREVADGEAVITIKTNASGMAKTEVMLPVGTYEAVETTPSVGYTLNETWKLEFVLDDTELNDGDIKDITPEISLQLKEQVIRADIAFSKVDIDGAKMAYIPFLVTLKDKNGNEIESHVIIADKEGRIDTKARAKTSLNNLDSYVSNGAYTGPLDDTAAASNIWFGENYKPSQDAKLGSLIYGYYEVKELSCELNKGNDMLKQDAFNVNEDISLQFEHGEKYSLGNIFIDLIVHPESDLIDVSTNTKTVSVGSSVNVKDTVRYDHLKAGETYKLKTEIYYVEKDAVKDINSARLLGDKTISFIPTAVDSTQTVHGTIDNTVTVNTESLNGGTVHAVDYIYIVRDGKDVLLAEHNTDLKEERQTLGVPYMGTTASDINTGTHVGAAVEGAGISDIIAYEHFPENRMFIIKEKIVNKDNPEEVIGESQLIINVSSAVTEPTEKEGGIVIVPVSGEIKMPDIKFDGTTFSGKTVVVQETILNYITNEVFLEHTSLDDEDQTIHYPEVETQASDVNTGTNTGKVGKTTIIDKVTITNAVIGATYKVKGELVYPEDCTDSNGTSHTKGEVIAVHDEVEVVADDTTVIVELPFEVDASALAGITTVVFEDLIHEDITVAVHHDYKATPQMINFPKVGTTATDKNSKEHIGVVGKTITIVDEVSLENLTEGDTYKVVGTLMKDGTTPFEVDGSVLTVESDTFVATAKDMIKIIEFTFDGKYLEDNSKFVVFEKLLVVIEPEEEGGVTDEVEVANHEDPTDENQTVEYTVEIGTTLTDKVDGGKEAFAAPEQTLVDEVSYTNLIPDEIYTAKGVLHIVNEDGTDGGILVIDGEEVAAEITFTPTKPSGSVFLEFTFDATSLAGKDVVAFEEVFRGEKSVAVHADITDEGQTVHIPEIRTMLLDPETKSHNIVAYWENKVVDTVSYTNLIPGEEYVMEGILVTKEDGKETKITSSITFVPDAADGEVEVPFTFDGTVEGGKTFVCFETLKHNDKVVAEHKDIEDEDQTIVIKNIGKITVNNPNLPRTPGSGLNLPKTGDFTNIAGWIVLFMASLFAIIVFVITRRKNLSKESK